MDFAKELKQHREMNGLTQAEVAKATGLNQSSISRWEEGKRSPSIEYCIILADFYGISLDELVGHEVKKNY